MKKSSWYLIIVAMIIALIALGKFTDYLEPDRGPKIVNGEETYDKYWLQPSMKQTLKIGNILRDNKVKVCGYFYIKEYNSNEYIVACSPDYKEWFYFVVYKRSKKVYRASLEMSSKLTPPSESTIIGSL